MKSSETQELETFKLSETVGNSSKVFNSTAGEFITADTALTLQANYMAHKANEGNHSPIRSEFFGADKLRELLDQPNCVGLKLYYGMTNDGIPQITIVGADKNAHNIGDNKNEESEPTNYLGFGPICPIHCS